MRKSTSKKTTTKSPAARKRAAKTKKGLAGGPKSRDARKRAARPDVPMDRAPVVPETRSQEAVDTTIVPAAKAGLPADVVDAVKAAAAKKADHIALLDLRRAAGFTDFFLLATGNNARQIRAIAEAVEEALSARRVKPSHTEGYERTEWILLDYFDFVVHVFSAQTRRFYGLERLWGSATPIDISGLVDAPAPKA
jgi:ribosome-associated protein